MTRLGRVVVRAGGVRAGADDGEVDLVVTLGDEPGGDVGGHLRLRPPDEGDLAAMQLGGDAIGGLAGGAQGGDLGVVLDHAQRADDRRRRADTTPPAGAAEARRESAPTSGRRRRPSRPPPHSRATRSTGSADSGHGAMVNTSGCSTTRGASSWATTSVASPSLRHDEHRQPFQRHRVVAGEVGQVVADREEQHVDALLGHRFADAVESVEVDRLGHASQCAIATGAASELTACLA